VEPKDEEELFFDENGKIIDPPKVVKGTFVR
jgi:hypothetical protein